MLPYPPDRMVGVWTVRGGWSINCVGKHTNTSSTGKCHRVLLNGQRGNVSQEEQAGTGGKDGRLTAGLVQCSISA